jgi:hypothetical protein
MTTAEYRLENKGVLIPTAEYRLETQEKRSGTPNCVSEKGGLPPASPSMRTSLNSDGPSSLQLLKPHMSKPSEDAVVEQIAAMLAAKRQEVVEEERGEDEKDSLIPKNTSTSDKENESAAESVPTTPKEAFVDIGLRCHRILLSRVATLGLKGYVFSSRATP